MRDTKTLAWAAGLFEGEGCWTGYKPKRGKYFQRTAVLVTTDLDVLQRFHAAVGFGQIYGPMCSPARKLLNRKPYWTWKTNSFEKIQALAGFFWPWLGERRRARAKELLMMGR